MQGRQFYLFFMFMVLISCANLAFGQGFNPYQHSYQGWDGEKIKKASPFRAFLNKFSLNTSLGYGRTFYNHELNNDVLETSEKLILLQNYTTTNDSIEYEGVTDWLNAPESVMGKVEIGPNSEYTILHADSTINGYKGSGFNIPINITLQFDIERFRIGAGIMYEMHSIKELKPLEQGTYSYVPNFNSTSMLRYFFTAGGKVYHLMGWDYYVDMQFGKVKYGSQYDKSALQNGMYFNLGFPLEFEFSEYFWFFVRPSVDFKNYSISTVQDDMISAAISSNIQHNQTAFYMNFGVRMKLPEIRRCPVKSCRTQLKHVHGGQEFRGQSFFKRQNPKIGELQPLIERKKQSKNK